MPDTYPAATPGLSTREAAAIRQQALADGFEQGRAAERDVIIRLAVDHGATYFAEPRPCGHKSDCSVMISARVPFADLIRKERGDD